MAISSGSTPLRINVLSQNMLLDKTRTQKDLILSQDDRIASLSATLRSFNGCLDVVGVQEAHKSDHRHNGEQLAQDCGFDSGYFVEHNQKLHSDAAAGRSGEHMGMFGAMVEDVRSIEIGDNRRALLAEIADVAFVVLHLRAGAKARAARLAQACRILEETEQYENAVVFGDFNEPPIRGVALARGVFRRAGFNSVFLETGQPRPATCPIAPYVPAMVRPSKLESYFVKRAWPIDDILVRGDRLRVISAGVLERAIVYDEEIERTIPASVPREPSDHDGVYATLEIAPQI